ncbi:MAG TPA: hypothetical protein VFR58_12755 [Flavisolibacter sp.]|nr:hypothetical protein [Flavisolibacter sp.]
MAKTNSKAQKPARAAARKTAAKKSSPAAKPASKKNASRIAEPAVQGKTRDKIVGATPDAVSIRMYCHGFGDCFLLIFKTAEEPVFYMLIDCGMLTGDSDLLKTAIADIKETCGGRLDLVVQTHEHKDHISGFNLKDDKGELLWDSIAVDQVWLAWTENTRPDGDKLAIELKRKHNKKKQALARSLSLYRSFIDDRNNQQEIRNTFRGDSYLAAQKRYATALGQVLGFMDISEQDVLTKAADPSFEFGLTMKDAMAYFVNRSKREDGPDISFWNPGDLASEKQTGLNGINFYFLGPPKDYARLRQMEDHTHAEMYLTDMGVSDNYYMALTKNGDSSGSPFHSKYFWSDADCTRSELDREDHVWTLYHGKKTKAPGDADHAWRKIEIDWLHNAGALALHLDSYTNNTSLVMAIEFEASGKVLLFPGDAQIGNWMSWTAPAKEGSEEPALKWKVSRDGKKEIITAEALLERTVFYKVGHHASHNATAKKSGLELMRSKDLVAMIPVDQEVAKRQGKRGWKMPADDLYERLKQKTKGRIIRLDKGNILERAEEKLPEGSKPTKQQRDGFSRKVTESTARIKIDGKLRPLFFEYLLEGDRD